MPHIHFTFPEQLQKELAASIPLRERSRFVAWATEQALQMLRLKKTLLSKKHVGAYSYKKSPNSIIKTIRKKSRAPKGF